MSLSSRVVRLQSLSRYLRVGMGSDYLATSFTVWVWSSTLNKALSSPARYAVTARFVTDGPISHRQPYSLSGCRSGVLRQRRPSTEHPSSGAPLSLSGSLFGRHLSLSDELTPPTYFLFSKGIAQSSSPSNGSGLP
ncbi:hypothetical protein CRENBAI_005986 [Crenichthys baileyi]|uniref:Uncharacterized protein n=1 Tax=Crenichthys baileyi TaxID=28760 RepID=A0AAV9SJC3_9TELE